ncbi:MAG TPA: LemA family protein [Rhodothermales bacterium]|nr:LemA family protein [Rhodothermales bacterium]
MRSTGAIILVIVLLLIGFAGCAGCGTYNSLVRADVQVTQAWADVETQYQRRADLIPNLVRTVQGAANFEKSTLESVIQARARATSVNVSADDLDDPEKVRQFQEAQQQLSGALGRLLVVSEAYPQLQATQAFRDLQVQLEGTENRINIARRDYNAAVAQYNTSTRTFPENIIAGMTGFDQRTPFEAEAGAEKAPEVQF